MRPATGPRRRKLTPAGTSIQAWRAELRATLIARRVEAPAVLREAWSDTITGFLLHELPVRPGMVVGFCWPIKAEYDARRLMRRYRLAGARTALPAVVQRAAALQFRLWQPGVAMRQGPLGIPYPADGPPVQPGIVLLPLVGFGRAGDRLGYGGGYFDRTLAHAAPRPLAVGVGFELGRIETTRPQEHDVPMDAIVTEAGMHWPEAGRLVPVEPAQFRELAIALMGRRGAGPAAAG